MWSGDTLHATETPDTRSSYQKIRDVGVLRDGYLHDLAYERSLAARGRRIVLTDEQRPLYPLLDPYLDTHDGYPPPVTRRHGARLRHLNSLHAAHGSIILMRLSLPDLNAYPLYSRDMSKKSRPAVLDVMRDLSGKRASYTADIQRGAAGQLQKGTHGHIVTALDLLPDDYREAVYAARHGPGGGIELPRHAAHATVIRSALADREKVARYVTRHPDGRLDTRSGPDYLQALEDELQRLAAKNPVVKLGWTRGVLPLST